MKTAAILLATLGLAVAGAAAAADHLSDVDYLKANRCRGLAEGYGVGQTASLDAMLKSEGRSRLEIVYARGQQELDRGKRDAGKTDGKDRFTAELNGPCLAFTGAAATTASAAKDTSSAR
jgi:hypothetical protein